MCSTPPLELECAVHQLHAQARDRRGSDGTHQLVLQPLGELIEVLRRECLGGGRCRGHLGGALGQHLLLHADGGGSTSSST